MIKQEWLKSWWLVTSIATASNFFTLKIALFNAFLVKILSTAEHCLIKKQSKKKEQIFKPVFQFKSDWNLNLHGCFWERTSSPSRLVETWSYRWLETRAFSHVMWNTFLLVSEWCSIQYFTHRWLFMLS